VNGDNPVLQGNEDNKVNKDTFIVGLLWIIISVVGEVLLFLARESMLLGYHGVNGAVQGATQAIIIDDAFFILSALGVPVFALVISIVGYSLLRFRNKNDNAEDAKPQRIHRSWAWSWLIWSVALCAFVIVVPGYTGLNALRATHDDTPDLEIYVTGQRWQWTYKYYEITDDYPIDLETQDPVVKLTAADAVLVLPNDSLIRFKISTPDKDVLHSFWIPAFRQKIDAVPGIVTRLDITTNRIGNYEENIDYRVQCAELCGEHHSTMSNEIAVVEKKEFEQWLTENKK